MAQYPRTVINQLTKWRIKIAWSLKMQKKCIWAFDKVQHSFMIKEEKLKQYMRCRKNESQHKICMTSPQLTDEKQKGFSSLKIRNMPWETNLHVVVCFIAVSGTEPSISLIYCLYWDFLFFFFFLINWSFMVTLYWTLSMSICIIFPQHLFTVCLSHF